MWRCKCGEDNYSYNYVCFNCNRSKNDDMLEFNNEFIISSIDDQYEVFEFNPIEACKTILKLNERYDYHTLDKEIETTLSNLITGCIDEGGRYEEFIRIITEPIEYYDNGNVKSFSAIIKHQVSNKQIKVHHKEFEQFIDKLRIQANLIYGEQQANEKNAEYKKFCESLDLIIVKSLAHNFEPSSYLKSSMKPVFQQRKPEKPTKQDELILPDVPEDIDPNERILYPSRTLQKYRYNGRIPRIFAFLFSSEQRKLMKEKEKMYIEDVQRYKKLQEIQKEYKYALNEVLVRNRAITEINMENHERYERELKAYSLEYEKYLEQLAKYEELIRYNDAINEMALWYEDNNDAGYCRYFEHFINILKADFEEYVNIEMSSVMYDEDNVLVIDFFLPDDSLFLNQYDFKYVKSKGGITHKRVSNKIVKSQIVETYYALYLALLNTVFLIDYNNIVGFVVLNAYKNFTDTRTGKRADICLMTSKVSKSQIEDIDLANVVPKDTFNYLNGKGVPNPDNLVEVKPLRLSDKNKFKTIESDEVIDTLQSNTNLAAIDWQDFETLVRDVFAKEFLEQDIEIKNTQPSNDGGIDVIAFNRNPYSGGIIVLQAKRYTNTVTPEPVRALRGTMQDVNAIRGILVTTSDFGKSSYDFANQNNITLINGDELLQLMNKHGYKMHIDLAKAKILNRR